MDLHDPTCDPQRPVVNSGPQTDGRKLADRHSERLYLVLSLGGGPNVSVCTSHALTQLPAINVRLHFLTPPRSPARCTCFANRRWTSPWLPAVTSHVILPLVFVSTSREDRLTLRDAGRQLLRL